MFEKKIVRQSTKYPQITYLMNSMVITSVIRVTFCIFSNEDGILTVIIKHYLQINHMFHEV